MDSWTSIFKSLKKVCKETRLKEFQFKVIYRIVITRNSVSKLITNACTVGIRTPLSTLLSVESPFTRSFAKRKKLYNGLSKLIVVRSPRPQRNYCSVLFRAPKKQNYSINVTILPYQEPWLLTLSMRHYIYSHKITSKGIYMHEFINRLSLKYNLEKVN